jgi:hypothetical protein
MIQHVLTINKLPRTSLARMWFKISLSRTCSWTDEDWSGIQIEDLDVNGDIDEYKFNAITLGTVTFLVLRKGPAGAVLL